MPEHTRGAIAQVMKVVAVLALVASGAIVATPMGPDSPQMLPLLLLVWFCVAVLIVLGLTYVLVGFVGRGKSK